VKTKIAAGMILLLLSNVAAAWGQQQSYGNSPSLSLPGILWTLQIDAPGFAVQINEVRPDGRRYLFAINNDTKVNLSVFLEKADPASKAKDCRENLQRRAKTPSPFKKKNIQFRQTGEMEILEVLNTGFPKTRPTRCSITTWPAYTPKGTTRQTPSRT